MSAIVLIDPSVTRFHCACPASHPQRLSGIFLGHIYDISLLQPEKSIPRSNEPREKDLQIFCEIRTFE